MGYIAKHNYAPISPRKARLIVDLVRGKSVDDALSALRRQPQRGARLLEKVVKSALANAEDRGEENVVNLKVWRAWVDESRRLWKMTPRARGRMVWICKRLCHIGVELVAQRGS